MTVRTDYHDCCPYIVQYTSNTHTDYPSLLSTHRPIHVQYTPNKWTDPFLFQKKGNMDPVHLFANKQFIVDKVHDTIKKAGTHKHVMNLGHGVMQGTPEENVATFFQTVRDYRY